MMSLGTEMMWDAMKVLAMVREKPQAVQAMAVPTPLSVDSAVAMLLVEAPMQMDMATVNTQDVHHSCTLRPCMTEHTAAGLD